MVEGSYFVLYLVQLSWVCGMTLVLFRLLLRYTNGVLDFMNHDIYEIRDIYTDVPDGIYDMIDNTFPRSKVRHLICNVVLALFQFSVF